MNNFLTKTLFLFLFPSLALADNSLTFAPPASDYSMVFLGNLFGIVDGVLSGTGSQIMGSMFGVFNSAVLALGGMIIMYTLLVSTMNTAHEGQMLGQKWSSIWIPVRSTVGLSLLIPKASGYCLMQIFVMWIVVQGVGAADKVWNAALSYLNRGGVIIQAQQINPASALVNGSAGMSGIASGAMNILAGQVCMLGLQTQLQNQRQKYLDQKARSSGPCSGTPSGTMATFCNTSVPDFLGSVNAVTTQNGNPTASYWTVSMPNFDSGSPYNFLNGICGQIRWNKIDTLASTSTTGTTSANSVWGAIGKTFGFSASGNGNPLAQAAGQGLGWTQGSTTISNNVSGNSAALASQTGQVGQTTSIGGVSLTADELQTAQMSRAIAIQQMFVDLSNVTQTIIGNAPGFSPPGSNNSSNSKPFIPNLANQQFGVPYTQNSTVCTSYSQNCLIWGPAAGSNGGGTLFNGTEFINALNDYSGIMMPTLNLLTQMNDSSNANNARAFIAQASAQGWIMAGAYFFNLVQIQGSSTQSAGMTDSNTGLDQSSFDATQITSPFGDNNSCSGGAFSTLCTWFGGDRTAVAMVQSLIDGSGISTPTSTSASSLVPKPNLTANPNRPAVAGSQSSTVYGFINNSVMMQTPGQPGLKPLTFANTINFHVDTTLYTLQQQSFSCGKVQILFFSFCLGQLLGNLFYNVIFLFIYNTLMQVFGQIINQVVMAFLMIPLSGMADIFKQGVQVLAAPGVNPIVALANMGAQYINFSGNLWLMLLNMAVTSALIPVFGIFIFALMSLALPLLLAWVGVMTTVGFTTAYYIPILPYMIFTFGAVSWLISVIEAMVAAPIVALGVTHPEGHDAFGKGEAAIMILINVFLRPSMMIIGYIAAIALSYVGVWILNSGYDTAIAFIQQENTSKSGLGTAISTLGGGVNDMASGTGGYSDWAGIYAFFFSILTYTSMYLVLIQKSFTLISYLPDKVLRWIGGNPESLGQESAQWAGEVQKQQAEGYKPTQDAQGQIDKQLGGYGMKGLNKAKSAIGSGGGGSGNVEATGDGGKGGGKGGGLGGKGGGGGGKGGGKGGGLGGKLQGLGGEGG
ncbi:type IVB secretion system protein DotA [Legionella lytica]|uniref:Type IVB secretion system protein DotA n=1 Tax=Legionella lytica TaxID=96232 RepID=A0ABY4YA46_9GAMM|nr:type IVB secretion system protein DotA [Legionella lytica]USQ14327.1 type IVB secretion system protein DotA [Legionella lytica]